MPKRGRGMDRKFNWENKYNIYLALLIVFFLVSIISIINHFIGLNESVEYERSVFISQIADQMKDKLTSSLEHNLRLTKDFAAVLGSVKPNSFSDVKRLFPEYAADTSVNQLFFLSSKCELYGIDGVKQWVSLSYDGYLIDAVSQPQTNDFIRVGMDQEFMTYSILLPTPITIDGHEISAVLYGWNSSEYRATLSSKLFEEKSSSLLVGKDGNIVIYPEEIDSENYGYNVFSYLSNQGISKEDLSSIQDEINKAQESTMLYELDNERWLFRIANYSDTYRILIMLPLQITSAGTYQNLYGLISSVAGALLLLFLIVGNILLSVYRHQKAQREKELQTDFLMKSAETKNNFLAKMSHDIRTPLNGIIGMNYIASTKLPPECSEVKDYLKKVDVSAQYLLGILNDILDMSKIESGNVELAATPFSLSELRDNLEAIVTTQIGEKNISFNIVSPKDIDKEYIGDELRIKQILMNLLSNAIKFTKQGSVTLEIKITPLDGNKDMVHFTVKDTGKGMTPKFLNDIFSPFAQEDAGITAVYGGSGLGLAIVKAYSDLMNGNISVTSELGKGSAFIVSIPLERATQTVPHHAVEEAHFTCDFPGNKALLCEDNDLNAEIAVMILEQFGLTVDRAENGKAGVEMFESSNIGNYNIIFMDVRMPVMGGYEATQAIRTMNREDAKTIPICALSANAFSDDVAKSLAAGMNEHLAKPIEISLLYTILKKYLN